MLFLATDNDRECIPTVTFIFFTIFVDLPLPVGQYSQLHLKKRVLEIITEICLRLEYINWHVPAKRVVYPPYAPLEIRACFVLHFVSFSPIR